MSIALWLNLKCKHKITYRNKPFCEGKLLHWQKHRSSSSVLRSLNRLSNWCFKNFQATNQGYEIFRPMGMKKAFLWNNISGIKMFSRWGTDECSFSNFWCSIIEHNFLPVLNLRFRLNRSVHGFFGPYFFKNFDTWSKFLCRTSKLGSFLDHIFG